MSKVHLMTLTPGERVRDAFSKLGFSLCFLKMLRHYIFLLGCSYRALCAPLFPSVQKGTATLISRRNFFVTLKIIIFCFLAGYNAHFIFKQFPRFQLCNRSGNLNVKCKCLAEEIDSVFHAKIL